MYILYNEVICVEQRNGIHKELKSNVVVYWFMYYLMEIEGSEMKGVTEMNQSFSFMTTLGNAIVT
jgi:hypothetical protein